MATTLDARIEDWQQETIDLFVDEGYDAANMVAYLRAMFVNSPRRLERAQELLLELAGFTADVAGCVKGEV